MSKPVEISERTEHQCLQRHGISRLPEGEGDKPPKKKFKSYPIGFFHIDITEVGTEDGKLHLFVAIDRTSKFVLAKLFDRATMAAAKTFLENLIKTVPYKIHAILTDNGIQFAVLPKNRSGPTARYRGHPFERVCWVNGIEHRLNQTQSSLDYNGQVERMNRTLKEATVNRYYYQTHQELHEHLDAFINAYNFAKRLKTLHGFTPYEFIVKIWAKIPNLFHFEPFHHNMGLYI